MTKAPERPRVLMVDEEEHVVRAMSYVLTREGFEVRSIPGARAALEAALGFLPDLVLLEVALPRMEGLEVLAKIRQQEALRNTSVILVTSQSHPRDVVAGLERGADDYITKPFDPRELLARLRAQLRMRRMQAQVLQAERWRVLLETAGAVAHEMSQPLTAVMGNLELLLHRMSDDQPEKAVLRRIFENGERAVDLLRKLQRIESYELKEYPGTSGILDIDRSSSRA
jgi:DNA-binding response OmpR family regulator